MIGIAERTTMDMDTTVTGINMEEKQIENIIRDILLIDVGDGIEFTFEKLESIREDDDYNNFRAYFVAHYGKIANKMKIDITTGDAITPGAIRYSYKTILDDDEIGVMVYNTETIIAELLGVSEEKGVTEIEVSKIRGFKDHPFKVIDYCD